MDSLTELTAVSDKELRKLSKLFDPLNDVVVVAVDTAENMTPGGIILPEQSKTAPQSGTIIAHGPGARSPVTGDRVPLSVAVGDRVIFSSYAGNDFRYGDIHLKGMREPDVMMKVKDDEALQPNSVRVKKRK